MKVLHAPVNVAGLGSALTEALGRLGVEATTLSYVSHPFGYRSDIELDLRNVNKVLWPTKVLAAAVPAILRYDVFHFHFHHSLLPWHMDLPLLKSFGKKIAIHFHGSDIRNPASVYHTAEKYRKGAENSAPPLSNPTQRARLAAWRKYADVIFVSTPDLLDIVPEAVYLPQAIDLRRWEFAARKPTRTGPLTVLHLPSDKGLKGSEFVFQAIDRLEEAGHPVRLSLAEGQSQRAIQDWIKSADVVVDQLLIGAYGMISVEAMAVGRPVICYISDTARPRYPDSLPVVSATPLTLEDAIIRLLQGEELCTQLGYRGRSYVEQHHDADAVARRLLAYYMGL